MAVLKLKNQLLTFDTNCYLINETAKLLGAWQYIIDQTRPGPRSLK